MPVFRLAEELIFPPPELARKDGLLAVGGDLSPERLLLAYRLGIFPWYSEGEPILWWAPSPRLVLRPEAFTPSRRLNRLLRQNYFRTTFDQAFRQVVENCAGVRTEKGEGTWITPEMLEAYCTLHDLGYGHSVECWREGELVGGIYGLSLGRIFFGESMFSRQANSSKAALAALVSRLQQWGFELIDCQVVTAHLLSLGAERMKATEFYRRLEQCLRHPTRRGRWSEEAGILAPQGRNHGQ